MADLKNIISTFQHVRQADGTFITVFPVNSINEVYYDIDKDITLADYLKDNTGSITVPNDTERFNLTSENVKLMDVVYVEDTGKKYFVIDTDSLTTTNGYSEIVTTEYLRAENATFGKELVPEIEDVGGIDASTLNGLPANEFLTRSVLLSEENIIPPTAIEYVPAEKIQGTLPETCVPAEVKKHTHELAGHRKLNHVTLLDITTTDNLADDFTILDNSISISASSESKFIIDYLGYAELEVSLQENEKCNITINGTKTELTANEKFTYSGMVNNSIEISGSNFTVTFDKFDGSEEDITYEGFMSAEDKEKVDRMYIDESGNAGFGDIGSHKFYSYDNFAAGSDNKVGSRAYHIKSFSGQNNKNGKYYVDGTYEDYSALNAILASGEELRCTIRNSEWKDSWCKISSVSYENDLLCLDVDNFYSNIEDNTVVHTYNPEDNYIRQYTDSKGNILSDNGINRSTGTYPRLGYAVQHNSAYLFIVNYPEFGSFEMCRQGASVGLSNISQNDFTFTAGYANSANGRYSGVMGIGNSAGYATVSIGNNNDGARAQSSFLAGYYNKVKKNISTSMLLGHRLNCSYDHQTIFGKYNNNKKDNIVEIGNGTGDVQSARTNAFEVKENGGITTKEKYFPGSVIAEKDITFLTTDGNYGNHLSDDILSNIKCVEMYNIAVDSNSATSTRKAIYPVTTYHKPVRPGVKNTEYFAYILIHADPLKTIDGVGLEPGRYILAYDMDIKSADDIFNTNIAGLYRSYEPKANGSYDTGWGGVNGALHLGMNHIYIPYELTNEYKSFGVYHTKTGDSKWTDNVEFEISNFRLYKLCEMVNPIKADIAYDEKYDKIYKVFSKKVLVDNTSGINYYGYIENEKEYIASAEKPDNTKLNLCAISEYELNHRFDFIKHMNATAGDIIYSDIQPLSFDECIYAYNPNNLITIDSEEKSISYVGNKHAQALFGMDYTGYAELELEYVQLYDNDGVLTDTPSTITINNNTTQLSKDNPSFSYTGNIDSISMFVYGSKFRFKKFNGIEATVLDGHMLGEDKIKLDKLTIDDDNNLKVNGELVAKPSIEVNITLISDNWTLNESTGFYTQTIENEKFTDIYNTGILSPAYGITSEQILSLFGSGIYASNQEFGVESGSITLCATFQKPSADIPITITLIV